MSTVTNIVEVKVAELKDIAKRAGVTGVSKLRKAELTELLHKSRDGRKELYRIRDAQWAATIIPQVLTSGTFFLPSPELLPEPVISGEFNGFSGLKKAQQEKEQATKENYRRKAEFSGRVQALKEHIMENGLRHIRWRTEADGFRLAVNRQAKAA